MNWLSERGVRTLSARVNLVAIVIVVIVGLAVHFVIPGFVGDALGDAMFAVLILLGIILVIPRLSLVLSAVVACVLCWTIELSQTSGIPAALSEQWPIFRYVFGTTFSAWDMIAYAVGIAITAVIIAKRRANTSRNLVDTQAESEVS